MKKILAIVLSALMLFSLCACGKNAKSTAMEAPSSAYYDYAAAEEAPAMPMPEPAEGEYGGFASNESSMPENAPDNSYDKIIYSASATVETTDFDGTIEKLGELVKQLGGFVESSSVNGANYYSRSRGYASNRSAYYTIRIPGTVFSDMMNRLSTLGNVPYSYTYTDNITAQYYDTNARLTAYKTQESRLLEMMELAETVEDVITIEDKLTDLRYRIESLQSTLNNWDRQVNYSTVNLSIEEVQEYTPETLEKVSYGRQLWLALSGGFRDAGSFFKDLLLDILSALPALIVIAVLLIIFIPRIKRRREKKKAEKENGADR